MTFRLPLSLPAARYRAHRSEIESAIAKVFRRSQFILGGETSALENEFAGFHGAKRCVGVASGTDALELSLRACGIGPGDAVITAAHTAVATVAAIERAGATPVLVDIELSTFTLDLNRLRDTIAEYDRCAGRKRPRLKAIIAVHLYGHPADMPAINAIARARGLRVIEDCAQSHGASLAGKMTGTWGDVAAFSFYPTKNLGAFGDGGAVVTNNSALANKVRLLREYGWTERRVSVMPGVNSRLDELQAALLRVSLKSLRKENARRQEHARDYGRLLEGTGLVLPQVRPGSVHVFHQYVVRSKRRDGLRRALARLGVPAQVHYPLPIHKQPAYRGRFFIGRGGLENSETAARSVLSLPMSPYLEPQHLQLVCRAVRKALRDGSTAL
jgi:dTDP-4-amino-4,6-dideoxygalactose transaminase